MQASDRFGSDHIGIPSHWLWPINTIGLELLSEFVSLKCLISIENDIGWLCVWVSFAACLQAQISVFPVWRPPSCTYLPGLATRHYQFALSIYLTQTKGQAEPLVASVMFRFRDIIELIVLSFMNLTELLYFRFWTPCWLPTWTAVGLQ